MKKKEFYIISGLNFKDNNRGTAALGYGAFSFIRQNYKVDGLRAINFSVYKKPWKYKFKGFHKEIINNEEVEMEYIRFYIWYIDLWIYKYIPFISRFTKIGRILERTSLVAAINGGDGFSDIYGTKTFESRLFDTDLAIKERIPLVILPQTLGPFKDNKNLKRAERILKYASNVYIRDTKFEPELKRMGVSFELTKDLSCYMKPEVIDIDIQPNSIGLNISGLCYSNQFKDLSGRFHNYPFLIRSIIEYFQSKNIGVYLVSHSYNYEKPEIDNDDLLASRQVFNSLKNKSNVYLIDKDLTPPQVKYVISRFDFFVGTRMHANFAAIFTNTPVFGLAYSYKYEGAFNYMGLSGRYASVLDIGKNDVDKIIQLIDEKYQGEMCDLRDTRQK